MKTFFPPLSQHGTTLAVWRRQFSFRFALCVESTKSTMFASFSRPHTQIANNSRPFWLQLFKSTKLCLNFVAETKPEVLTKRLGKHSKWVCLGYQGKIKRTTCRVDSNHQTNYHTKENFFQQVKSDGPSPWRSECRLTNDRQWLVFILIDFFHT